MDAVVSPSAVFAFDNTYVRLPEHFYARVSPDRAPNPHLLKLNVPLAKELGLDPDRLAQPDAVDVLAGNRIAPGSEPIAMAYAGHQFGNWVPQLGDGRALLLGEVTDPKGHRYDIQLKGSGQTPFSRRGDGKAPLGPVLREFIISEAMAALGIPTTRSLAAVATGETVYRETALPGAVLTRVASSHVRIGTFQYFYARQDEDALKILTNYVIERHYPEHSQSDVPALALLNAVMERQAKLVAKWMGVGFIHGVMNTDNMTLSGETIDYGPCAFMDTFRERQVFSSIDMGGRYAYGNQPRIAHWNIAQLAQALLPLIPGSDEEKVEVAQASIDHFGEMSRNAWLDVMRRKLGLSVAQDDDAALVVDLLSAMETNAADFTLTFRSLSELPGSEIAGRLDGKSPRSYFAEPAAFDVWFERWLARIAQDPMPAPERRTMMRSSNPLFIPRNHRVEAALEAAHEGDLRPLENLNEALARPYDDQPIRADLAAPPGYDEVVYQTFCGT